MVGCQCGWGINFKTKCNNDFKYDFTQKLTYTPPSFEVIKVLRWRRDIFFWFLTVGNSNFWPLEICNLKFFESQKTVRQIHVFFIFIKDTHIKINVCLLVIELDSTPFSIFHGKSSKICDFMGKYQKHIHSNRYIERSIIIYMNLIFAAIERAHTGASFQIVQSYW